MKVLSVKNPWAYLIIHYGKDIENRSRKTNYRGCIAIHASQKSDMWAYTKPQIDPDLQKIFREIYHKQAEIEKLNGHIIGTVELYNCTYRELTMASNNSPWAELDAAFHYWLKDPEPLAQPVLIRGALGLWE